MKRMSEKISEVPLKCDSEKCPYGQISGSHDIVVIYYRRGEAADVILPMNRMLDFVEMYHVDCAPTELRIKINRG